MTDVNPMLAPLLQYGAFGVLAFIIWAVIFRLAPGLREAFKELGELFKSQLEKQEKRCDEARERQEARHQRDKDKQDERHERLAGGLDRLCERMEHLERGGGK